jgi:hypothetical protein
MILGAAPRPPRCMPKALARARGITKLSVPSSITAEHFYTKLGFADVRGSYHGVERTIIMERRL